MDNGLAYLLLIFSYAGIYVFETFLWVGFVL